MDFRTCPSCQASVLEDDVEDCPFCGASMSGKPKPAAAKPPATPAAKPIAATDKPKGTATPASGPRKPGTPAAKRPGASAASGSGDEDPFEIDTTAVRRAIKLSPRPTKTRTYQVVCPMCETAGFLPPEDAGKDVQCCNPECLVPIFKSKRPEVEAVVEEDHSGKKMMILVASLAAAAVVGAVLYFTVFSNTEDPNLVDSDPQPHCQACPPVDEPTECADCPPPEPKQISLAELQKQVLAQIANAAIDRRNNLNPSAGTQMASEAFADVGEIYKAIDQLKRLQTTARNTPHYQVLPLAEIAWAQLKQGDSTAAKASAAEALEKSKALPPELRKSFDAVISLAGVLVALGQPDDAKRLIKEQSARGWGGTAAVLWRGTLDFQTYDILLESQRPYHIAMEEPLQIGVVSTLVARNFPSDALAYALSLPTQAQRDAGVAAWAGRLAELNSGKAVATVTSSLEGKDVSTAGRVRIWSAVASHLATQGLKEEAQSALQQALAAAEKFAKPTPASIPSMRDIYESQGKPHLGMSDPSPFRSAASAWTDIVLVALQLGETEQAKTALENAMSQARAMAPSPARTEELLEEINKRGDSVRSMLNSQLGLGGSSSKVTLAFNRYRLQANELNDRANARLAFQVELLRAIAGRGLLPEVWGLVQAQSSKSGGNDEEPYFSTSLPGYLQTRARLAGETALRGEIESALKQVRDYQYNLVDLRGTQIEDLIRQKQYGPAAEQIKQVYQLSKIRENRKQLDPDELDVAMLSQFGVAQKQASVRELLTLIVNASDTILKEDASLLFGGYSVQAGTAPEVWELLKSSEMRDLGALERTAMFRGFLTGIAHNKTAADSSVTISE